jgi:hypothetical protein
MTSSQIWAATRKSWVMKSMERFRSRRIRSTPPSFNELRIRGGEISVRVRNLARVPTPDMLIDAIPPDARPPREPGEPIAPVGAVPPTDPPIH